MGTRRRYRTLHSGGGGSYCPRMMTGRRPDPLSQNIIQPYSWTTYNVLVLPPSFPYGGMENPNSTFATPTIISGVSGLRCLDGHMSYSISKQCQSPFERVPKALGFLANAVLWRVQDRQNVDVIAHELSHSWSGNLVSNASWEHFWLNEGWTTYLERRVISTNTPL
jgi:leukotriene-A4 hydrolase